jgi:hypothetical protein
MWKWLSCKLWGTRCVWRTTHTERYTRDAHGVYVNVTPPRVLCERHTQQCDTCGARRTCEVRLALSS